MCSAGPEAAVLDCYGPEADPVYWRRGRGGGVVAGLQVACEAYIQDGKVLERSPSKNWEFRPSYTDNNFLYLVLQIFSGSLY